MPSYIPQLNGYIADVPVLYFKRCDGEIFVFDELTAFSFTPTVDFIAINAGQSSFPVAHLPGQSNAEINATSGQFNMTMFEMATGNKAKKGNYDKYMTEHLRPDGVSHKVTLQETPLPGSVSIRGLQEVTGTPGPGKFSVNTVTKEITFEASETEEMEIHYQTRIADAVQLFVDNKSSTMGELVAIWPLFGSGTDCSDSAIIGKVALKIFRVRITTAPGFDTSYKSAMTNSITMTAMDAKRDDGNAYSITHYKI